MRRRIQLLVVGVIALVLLCAAIPLAVLIRSTVGERSGEDALRQANDAARTLRTSSTSTASINSYLADVHNISITLPNGTVLGTVLPSETDLPRMSPPPSPAAASTSASNGVSATRDPRPQGEGYPGAGPGGGGVGGDGQQAQLRPAGSGQVATATVQTAAGPYLIQVYVPNSERYSGVYGWWAILAGVAVALLLVGAGVAELFTRRIVRPLTDTAETANRIGSGDLTARAPIDGPREIAAVGVALNSLADRIDALLAEERETVADLSHRLRTPLTALRLNAESLRNPEEAERIGEDVSTIERTLTAVIRAARRPQREGRMPSADLTAVVTDRLQFWSALAEDQGRTHRAEIPPQSILVRASAEDLAAAVDALLENVIAHTPEETAFALRLTSTAHDVVLTVCDEGPGLPPDAVVRGRSDRGSTGLGLDIARRAAEAGGGSMELTDAPGGGAMISLRFVHASPGLRES